MYVQYVCSYVLYVLRVATYACMYLKSCALHSYLSMHICM